MPARHRERHRTEHMVGCARQFWARTMVSFPPQSLVLGVAAAHGTRSAVLVAGVAGLVAPPGYIGLPEPVRRQR